MGSKVDECKQKKKIVKTAFASFWIETLISEVELLESTLRQQKETQPEGKANGEVNFPVTQLQKSSLATCKIMRMKSAFEMQLCI
jgi:hypothetical protein